MDEKTQETETLLIPILMNPDGEVLISRESLELGWTRLYYIEALSGMTLVFNPLENDDQTWRILKEITMAFPDTEGRTPGVFYDFCDGTLKAIHHCKYLRYGMTAAHV